MGSKSRSKLYFHYPYTSSTLLTPLRLTLRIIWQSTAEHRPRVSVESNKLAELLEYLMLSWAYSGKVLEFASEKRDDQLSRPDISNLSCPVSYPIYKFTWFITFLAACVSFWAIYRIIHSNYFYIVWVCHVSVKL